MMRCSPIHAHRRPPHTSQTLRHCTLIRFSLLLQVFIGDSSYNRVVIDLRLMNGTVPALITRDNPAQFYVAGHALALDYTVASHRSGDALIVTLTPSVPTTSPPSSSPSTTVPIVTGLPNTPISGYVLIVGDVQLDANGTLAIVVNPLGGGGYLNVTGCVDLAGSLDIDISGTPVAGQNISFLESPCISFSGSSTVVIQVGTHTRLPD